MLARREYYRRFRADQVILWQTPSNDVWNNLFPTHGTGKGVLKPTFSLVNGDLQWLGEEIGQEISVSVPRINAVLTRRFSPEQDEEWERQLPEPYTPLLSFDGPANRTWEEHREKGLLQGENLLNEKSHLAIYLTPPSKRMKYALALTRRLLQQIETEVSSRGGIFTVFRPLCRDAMLVNEHDNVSLFDGRYCRASRDQRESSMAQVNQGFHQILIPVRLDDHRVGPWDAHLNEHAVDEAMAELGDRLALTISRERPKRSEQNPG